MATMREWLHLPAPAWAEEPHMYILAERFGIQIISWPVELRRLDLGLQSKSVMHFGSEGAPRVHTLNWTRDQHGIHFDLLRFTVGLSLPPPANQGTTRLRKLRKLSDILPNHLMLPTPGHLRRYLSSPPWMRARTVPSKQIRHYLRLSAAWGRGCQFLKLFLNKFLLVAWTCTHWTLTGCSRRPELSAGGFKVTCWSSGLGFSEATGVYCCEF